MDLPSPSHNDPAVSQETSAAEKISAYYSLVFPTVTFYVRTLSVTIGRRCTNVNATTSSPQDALQVDVDLGALKSVSRLHAKIEYDQEEDRFVLLVVGRNGAWVDGVWSASGTRASLGERSQIQIASRTFHFVLPPPPPPEDTPSPSSQSSNRPRSPSVDITSISPPSTPQSHSPPPIETKPPPPLPEPQLPTPKPTAAKTNPKKRKKPEPTSPPKPKAIPAEIPEKPSLTLRQLIQRAIKDLGGKATLQEICTWIMNGYEHYRHVDDKWMSSVRHTLSSDKHFTKMERCGGTRGKGFFWSVEEDGEDQAVASASGSAVPTAKASKAGKGTKKKDKEKPLDPPLKKIKGDSKSMLPSLTTTTPREIKPPPIIPSTTSNPPPSILPASAAPTLTAATVPPASQVTSGVFAYSSLSSSSYPSQNPYAALTQGNWGLSAAPTSASTPAASASTSTSLPSTTTPASSSSAAAPQQPAPQLADVSIPIILAPIPPTHPDYSPTHPNNSAKEGYMILHERTLILDPDVFSGVSGDMLKELEKMGASKALGILAQHMVRALKERRAARGRSRGRGRGRGQPKGRRDPPFTHEPLPLRPTPSAAGTAPAPSGEKDKVPFSVEAKPPVPVPVLADSTAAPSIGDGRADSPLVVIDDSDGEDRPAAKRRKLDEAVDAMSMVA